MVKVKINNDEFYLDGYYKENMDLLNQRVQKNWDGIGYFCGYEGDGKTTFVSQTCYYLDPTFKIDRVVFTGESFIKAAIEAKPFQAIMYDESYYSFNNKNMWNETTKKIISLLTQIRKKKLFIMIISPTFFDIQKYIAIHRSMFMVQVHAEGLERGFFKFYNRENKHQLYIKGRKDHDMFVVKPNFFGRFTSFNPIDQEAYEAKKDAALKELEEKSKPKENELTDAEFDKIKVKNQSELIAWLRRNRWLKTGAMGALSTYFNVNRRTVFSRLDEYRESQNPDNSTGAGRGIGKETT